MSPAERAKAICEQGGDNFREVVEAHMLRGIVVATPELFLAARPVPRSADAADLWTPWPREECDAWFIWLGVGHPAALQALTPFPLPWIGWHRQGRRWTDCHWWLAKAFRKRFASALAPR